jgi:hypothetical protein
VTECARSVRVGVRGAVSATGADTEFATPSPTTSAVTGPLAGGAKPGSEKAPSLASGRDSTAPPPAMMSTVTPA